MANLASFISTAVSIKGILNSGDSENVQSFVDLAGQEEEEDKGEIGRGATKKKEHKKKRDHHKKGASSSEAKEGKKSGGEKKSASEKKPAEPEKQEADARPASPRIPVGKSTFAQISKELKARKQAQIAAQAKARKGKKVSGRRQEEIYTDKDRAAAVNLGTRDIKQSLKIKRRQDRSHALQIPEEAEPGTLLALGNNELRSGDVKIALNFVNKALELSPSDKNCLVARSKCYLLLGEPQMALQDAETAIQGDRTFVRAIYQKAEALYHLGDFEHSLMYYHRGHRLRPELEIFRLGVQKAQEAIENTIGSAPGLNEAAPQRVISTPRDSITTKPGDTSRTDRSSTGGGDTKRSTASRTSVGELTKRESVRSKSAAAQGRRGSKNLLGELGADRIYLESLLKHPDIKSSNPDAPNVIITQAEEGIAFLKSRQEFWRQQRSNTTPSSKKG